MILFFILDHGGVPFFLISIASLIQRLYLYCSVPMTFVSPCEDMILSIRVKIRFLNSDKIRFLYSNLF